MGLASTQVSMKMAVVITAIGLPTMYQAFVTTKNHVWGRPMNPFQMSKIKEARDFISSKQSGSPAGAKFAEGTALTAKIRVHETFKDGDSGEDAWGVTMQYGQIAGKVIHLKKMAFLLDKRLLASLLIHESVHAHQWDFREKPSENEAYQIQSDMLRSWGLTAGDIIQARDLFKEGSEDVNDGFLDDEMSTFVEYGVADPAWKR